MKAKVEIKTCVNMYIHFCTWICVQVIKMNKGPTVITV